MRFNQTCTSSCEDCAIWAGELEDPTTSHLFTNDLPAGLRMGGLCPSMHADSCPGICSNPGLIAYMQ